MYRRISERAELDTDSCNSVFSVVNGVLFTAPPYNFSVGETGLISLSPFILCIIGEAISGPLNDYICLSLAKRNHGVYEPEFRLVLMVVVVFAVLALVLLVPILIALRHVAALSFQTSTFVRIAAERGAHRLATH